MPATKLKSGQIAQDTLDGWTLAVGTWTYASASTITVPTDATTIYQKGDRIRFKQGGGYKYAVIVAVAATLLTIAVNNDYTVANSAITDMYYSHQANPVGYPGWFGYDPTWTGFSTAPTVDVLFKIMGREITLLFIPDAGTSNSATFDFTLPVAPITLGAITLAISIIVCDGGNWQNSPGVVGLFDANTTAKVGKTISSLAGNAYGGFTTSSGKGLSGTITYRF